MLENENKQTSAAAAGASNVTLASALEEEAHNEHLQRAHGDDQEALDHAKVDDSVLGADNSSEVAVLTCAEVLLVTRDGGKLAGDLVNRLLKSRRLFRRRALLSRQLGALLMLDLLQSFLVSNRPFGSKRGALSRVRTEMSKSTYFSANVLIWLLKQNEYSPAC